MLGNTGISQSHKNAPAVKWSLVSVHFLKHMSSTSGRGPNFADLEVLIITLFPFISRTYHKSSEQI